MRISINKDILLGEREEDPKCVCVLSIYRLLGIIYITYIYFTYIIVIITIIILTRLLRKK